LRAHQQRGVEARGVGLQGLGQIGQPFAHPHHPPSGPGLELRPFYEGGVTRTPLWKPSKAQDSVTISTTQRSAGSGKIACVEDIDWDDVERLKAERRALVLELMTAG